MFVYNQKCQAAGIQCFFTFRPLRRIRGITTQKPSPCIRIRIYPQETVHWESIEQFTSYSLVSLFTIFLSESGLSEPSTWVRNLWFLDKGCLCLEESPAVDHFGFGKPNPMDGSSATQPSARNKHSGCRDTARNHQNGSRNEATLPTVFMSPIFQSPSWTSCSRTSLSAKSWFR